MATPLKTERSDAPKATEPKATGAATEPVRATPTPKGTIAFDSTMIGQTIATGPGVVTGLAMIKQGNVTPYFDNTGNATDGMLKLPGVVSMYANDLAGGACAKMGAPLSGDLVLQACPSGSSWQISLQ
jgi:hypothetical protein